VRTGQHAVHSELVSILDIMPTICDLLGIRAMLEREIIRGESLVTMFGSDSDTVRRAA
jgi:arylsulfatase A-like enzyme